MSKEGKSQHIFHYLLDLIAASLIWGMM